MRSLLIMIFASVALQLNAQKKAAQWQDSIQPAVFSLTMVMMHDVVNPPAASRYYAYCTMAAYEIIAQHDSSVTPMSSFIRYYKPMQIEVPATEYNYQVAAVYSILEMGKRMLPSGYMLQSRQDHFLQQLKKKKYKASVIAQSVKVAEQAAAHIVAFSQGDSYNKLSTHRRYRPTKDSADWFPTPPSYMEAVEPHWRTIRTMVIDSSNQFIPHPLVPFSVDSTSDFFKLAMEVYNVSNEHNEEHELVAGYWDCNPFVVATSGHMMLGFKKISPGGHWMNIAGIAAKTAGLDFNKSLTTQMLTAITLMDAFISCWDEKYRSNRIRPETFINRHIDIKWQPLLQTPPFPEYTSGHSVISSASAEVLSYLLGESFEFTDNTELMFELPERKFKSFKAAAEEAGISRLYGGIHFRDSIEYGQIEGAKIGNKIISVIRDAGLKSFY